MARSNVRILAHQEWEMREHRLAKGLPAPMRELKREANASAAPQPNHRDPELSCAAAPLTTQTYAFGYVIGLMGRKQRRLWRDRFHPE
jgi:hypothetical protein